MTHQVLLVMADWTKAAALACVLRGAWIVATWRKGGRS